MTHGLLESDDAHPSERRHWYYSEDETALATEIHCQSPSHVAWTPLNTFNGHGGSAGQIQSQKVWDGQFECSHQECKL
jgi:hypothetical protein